MENNHIEPPTHEQLISFEEFVNDLKFISEVAPGSLSFKRENPLLSQVDELLEYIDVFPLKTLYELYTKRQESSNDQVQQNSNKKKEQVGNTSTLERLINILDFEKSMTTVHSSNNQQHKILSNQLNKILETEPASYELARQRAKEITPVIEYISTCRDHQHSSILASTVYIVNNKIVSMQWSKLSKYEIENPQFMACLKSKIHYVPNLKPQTDLTLGDCSYLDTCHKLGSCRYLHYLQYIPEFLTDEVTRETHAKNIKIKSESLKIPFYTHGNCSSLVIKEQAPPQWIRCDVRKFDFNIIGKFSVVIADPAWNIHMNLPYGTCNDIELLQLPLNHLQDEGILFLWVTGRAIELGKESLANWGYKVINELSWIKTNQLGRTIVTGRTGHWLNHSKEHLLLGVKGDPQWINKHIDIDLIVSTTRETSRKPDELYGIIERLVGPHARKLEIFGRDHNIRPGWLTIGNQLSGTCIHEMDVKRKYDKFIASNKNPNKWHKKDMNGIKSGNQKKFQSQISTF